MDKSAAKSENTARSLRFLYDTLPGRVLLRALVRPGLSRRIGRLLDRRASRRLIPRFVRSAGIDLSQYEAREFKSFNDFFTRRIRPELRPVDPSPASLVAPCDGRLSAYRIDARSEFEIKGSRYTTEDLLGGAAFARAYLGGLCLVYRLGVDDYHRYCFIDDGRVLERRFLPGVLHTVQPVALRRYPVFAQNSREYCRMQTAHLGEICQIEVGAMLVGRIVNREIERFRRGEEKGRFEYGGSTIVVLLKKDAVTIPDALLSATGRGEETRVRQGERIGEVPAAGRLPEFPEQAEAPA